MLASVSSGKRLGQVARVQLLLIPTTTRNVTWCTLFAVAFVMATDTVNPYCSCIAQPLCWDWCWALTLTIVGIVICLLAASWTGLVASLQISCLYHCCLKMTMPSDSCFFCGIAKVNDVCTSNRCNLSPSSLLVHQTLAASSSIWGYHCSNPCHWGYLAFSLLLSLTVQSLSSYILLQLVHPTWP